MENLRLFLYPYDPESSVYFGCRFKAFFSQGYMSGGGGYVLSRDALRRLNLFAMNSTTTCKLNGDSEDMQIGRCLQDVGVVAGDTRDFQGHHRFLPVSPLEMFPEWPPGHWLENYFYFKPNVCMFSHKYYDVSFYSINPYTHCYRKAIAALVRP